MPVSSTVLRATTGRDMGAFRKSSAHGFMLLAAAAGLSVMSALALAMIGAPGTQLGQAANLINADQARYNAESGYYLGLSAVREAGLATARLSWNGSIVEIPGGVGTFRLDFVDVDAAPIHFSGIQTIVPGGNLEGISLPSGSSLPRREGSFTFDGLEYRYDSFESDAGIMTNVRPVDPSVPMPLVFDPSVGTMSSLPRTDIQSVGHVGNVEIAFRRQIEERPSPPCDLPWGGQIQVGQSVTAFSQDLVSCGDSCQSETRTCSAVRLPPRSPLVIEYDSDLSGGFGASSCSVGGCACALLDGGNLPDGGSIRLWRATSVPALQSCEGQDRTCTDGVLSGSAGFIHSNCSVQGSFSHAVQPLTHPERTVDQVIRDLYGRSMVYNRQFDFGAENDQVWQNPGQIEVFFLARYTSARLEFGYLRGLEGREFVSILRSGRDFPDPIAGNVASYSFQIASRPEPGMGRVLLQEDTGEYFRFAARRVDSDTIWSSRVRDNADGFDRMVTFTLNETQNGEPIRVLAWEDGGLRNGNPGGDRDHNDLLIEVRGARPAGPEFCEGCQ
jgi:hypothetical protein